MQGWGEQRRAERWQAQLHSSAFLFHLLTFTVSSSSPPPFPYTQWVHGDWWCRFIFFHFSLSQIKFRKHQLSVHLQLDEIQANVLISCTGEIPMDVWMCMSFSVCIELSCNMPISILHCNTNYTFGFLCIDYLILLCGL